MISEAFERRLVLGRPSSAPSQALFLDRDGVLVEDCHYLSDPAKVDLCLGAKRLIEEANRHNIQVVLVTNQSGIARGYFQWNDYELVNQRMQQLLGTSAPLAAIYANGYGPDAPKHSWRKPNPEMLLQASKDLNIDLSVSMMIGDRLSDLQAGAAAGLAIVFHVLSGYGLDARASVIDWHSRLRNDSDQDHRTCCKPPRLKLLDTLLDFPYSLLGTGRMPST